MDETKHSSSTYISSWIISLKPNPLPMPTDLRAFFFSCKKSIQSIYHLMMLCMLTQIYFFYLLLVTKHPDLWDCEQLFSLMKECRGWQCWLTLEASEQFGHESLIVIVCFLNFFFVFSSYHLQKGVKNFWMLFVFQEVIHSFLVGNVFVDDFKIHLISCASFWLLILCVESLPIYWVFTFLLPDPNQLLLFRVLCLDY